MASRNNLSDYKVVRLNAKLFPVDEYEVNLFQKYGLEPVQVEAHTPDEIIPHVADCDALFVVSAALPEEVVESLSRCRVISRKGIGTFEQIDPFTEEEAPPDHPFMELDNIVLTPHVASASVQAKQDVARGAIENVVAILSGHWPHPDNIVNRGLVPRVPLADYDPSLFEE